MSFQLFVSYGRADNIKPVGVQGAIEFVTLLHKNLEQKLIPLGQPHVNIWRDTSQIEGGTQFHRAIDVGIKDSEMLLVVLTQAWLESRYCREELDAFVKKWAPKHESYKDRIVVAMLTWIDPAKWPEALRGQSGFRFYESENNRDGAPERSYYSAAGKAQDQFFDVVEKMAKFVHERAKGHPPIKRIDEPELSSPVAGRRTIYVAKAYDDMRAPYQTLVSELCEDYNIVPDPNTTIPVDRTATEFIDAALAQAEFSIHLLGESDGYSPAKASPFVALQLERAAARAQTATADATAQERGFFRYVFAPKVFVDPDDPTTAVADRDPAAVRDRFAPAVETDKIDGSGISDFVVSLKQYLKASAPVVPLENAQTLAPGSRVFLDFDPIDWEYVGDFATALNARGIDYKYAAFEDTQLQNDRANRELLQDCDSIVRCWAKTSDAWVTSRGRTPLFDWHGNGRDKPYLCQATVAGPPVRVSKQLYSKAPPPDAYFLDLTALDKPNPESLDPLIQKVRPQDPSA